MIKKLTRIICLLGVGLLPAQGFTQLNIIPKPAEVVLSPTADSFTITPKTVLVIERAELQPSADFFNDYLKEVYGFSLKTTKKAVSDNAITLGLLKEAGDRSGAYAVN